MSIFEMLMLICFGLSWPANILKSLRSRSVKGKSVIFLFAVWVGYIAGITHKVLYSCDFVLWIYVLNTLMVSIDIALYFRNRRYEAALSRTA
jgi:lipopolysaccharide export LptBFGC system permease protein LptF